jgi:hypothetical protein
MRQLRRSVNRTQVLIAVLLICVATGGWKCNGTSEPKTVANALTTMGNIKRNAKKAGEITAQQDLDISRKLDAANRSYRQFVTDEQARIASGTSDPAAKAKALSELRSLVSGLTDPSVLGFKSQSAQAAWTAAVMTLNTILAGLGG